MLNTALLKAINVADQIALLYLTLTNCAGFLSNSLCGTGALRRLLLSMIVGKLLSFTKPLS
ncbi:MAG: hypothetical protein LUO95_09540 [Methylococcaceae bacterium]|nr:hypothetical protein [Methylococcaceae bacterium]MDD1610820.1 hypothetical protein [Methylococcaceae bacterium]MDD1617642.1 hypothetical protein [Methylococcaceae bacterium]